jgi:hypothetical protein
LSVCVKHFGRVITALLYKIAPSTSASNKMAMAELHFCWYLVDQHNQHDNQPDFLRLFHQVS